MHSCLCFSSRLRLQKGGGRGGRQHPVSVRCPWNPSALVFQSITTYCRGAFCSQVSVCLPSFLSLLFLYQDAYPGCLFCLYSSVTPPLPPPAFIHLCSHVCVCVALAAPALCCCASAVAVILFPLLILSIAFSQEAAAGTEIGRTSSASEKRGGGTATHYSVLYGVTAAVDEERGEVDCVCVSP